ncbi:MAG TPA: carboxypeptidase-like regulatory domain-containing protein [Chthoniobacterales bacterium]|nr:carboxypeptidase-like regulatory domain-containing protein [Chthoniobacterales bacterium]
MSSFNPLRGCNSGKALLIELTHLFRKRERSSTNAKRRTPNAKRLVRTVASTMGVLIATLGVAFCSASEVSAAEKARDVTTANQTIGALAGRISATFGNQVVYGVGETVTLTPLFPSGSSGHAVTTRTDADGRFAFGGLAPGQYELRTQFDWTTSHIEVYDDGTRDRMYADHSKQLDARVLVKPKQTARVTTFTESATRDGFYAYGGLLSKAHHPLVSCR